MQTIINKDLFKLISGLSTKSVDSAIERVEKRYNEPNRFYHNCEHINHMLEKALLFNYPNQNLAFSILYHDAIYSFDPIDYLKNEENSGMLFLSDYLYDREYDEINNINDDRVSLPIISVDDIKKIYNAICRTKYHIKFNNDNNEYDLGNKLLDLDLSSLALPKEKFIENSANIIKEFNSSGKYKLIELINSQNIFVNALLDKKNIFKLKPFSILYEDIARDNLKTLIKLNNAKIDDLLDNNFN